MNSTQEFPEIANLSNEELAALLVDDTKYRSLVSSIMARSSAAQVSQCPMHVAAAAAVVVVVVACLRAEAYVWCYLTSLYPWCICPTQLRWPRTAHDIMHAAMLAEHSTCTLFSLQTS